MHESAKQMQLNEALDRLNKAGLIVEDTETADDQYADASARYATAARRHVSNPYAKDRVEEYKAASQNLRSIEGRIERSSLKRKIAHAQMHNLANEVDLKGLLRELTAFSNQLEQEGGDKVWITTSPKEYGIMASYTHDRDDLEYIWKPNQGIAVIKQYYLGDLDDTQTIKGIKTIDDFKNLLRKDFGPNAGEE